MDTRILLPIEISNEILKKFSELLFKPNSPNLSERNMDELLSLYKDDPLDSLRFNGVLSLFDCDDSKIPYGLDSYIHEFVSLLNDDLILSNIRIMYETREIEDGQFSFSTCFVYQNNAFLHNVTGRKTFDSENFRYAFNEFLLWLNYKYQFFSFVGYDSGDLIFFGNKIQALEIGNLIDSEIDDFQYYNQYYDWHESR